MEDSSRPTTTTISTIAINAGKKATIVVALLKVFIPFAYLIVISLSLALKLILLEH
uniref:Uncharacterized protein n=1 Tax=Loa loa TaxID=7209 RepID=A0A1I7VUS5_LOALO